MMPQIFRLAAAVLLSTALASGAQAQTKTEPGGATDSQSGLIGGPLANVNVVQMSVAPLSEQSRGCGFEESLIIDSFRQPLDEKGIIIQEAAHIWVQLQVTTLRYEGDICISYIDARALQNTRYQDLLTSTSRSGRVLMWSDGGLFVSGVSNHSVTTNIGWRDLARSFMRKWEMDQ